MARDGRYARETLVAERDITVSAVFNVSGALCS
jgi:hypothetical protein